MPYTNTDNNQALDEAFTQAVMKEASSCSGSIEEQIELARSYCFAIAKHYWKSIRIKTGVSWYMRSYKGVKFQLGQTLKEKVIAEAHRLSKLEPKYAGYFLSIHYMNFLPKSYREKHGIYYTPINVVNTMIDEAIGNGIDLKTARIIDPASGGSAFLVPICREMILEGQSDEEIVQDIESRLIGLELDPFAAWLSQFLIECELAFIAPTAKKPKQIVYQADALTISSKYFGCFDYVIGNPPYGKICPNKVPLERYNDIISGTPNLYQLFYKLAIKLACKNGFVHIITPTSFIGGHYFKALRRHIENNASAISFSFFQNRKNIFCGVQQELVISLLKKRVHRGKANVNSIVINKKGNLSVSKVGSVYLKKESPWALPKTLEELSVAKLFQTAQHNLSSIGYGVHTGYVVPHRSIKHLSNRKRKAALPMVWSEAIQNDGFEPEVAYSKGRYRWYCSDSSSGLIKEPAILIKRTSSKEQLRRIHAVLVGQSYIDIHGGYYVENHVNVLKVKENYIVDLIIILQLIKSRIVDQLFRCISGTVTVSSSELNQLPMPSPKALRVFEQTIKDIIDQERIEHAVRVAYEIE